MSAKSQARIRNLSRRALYALEASQRVAKAVIGGKSVQDALGSERANFEAHKKRSKDSLKVAGKLDAYVAAHGRMASWIHGPKTATDRPHHVAAHGRTFDILAGPPKQTGSYPGEENGCRCEFGRVIEGAKTLR